MSSTNPYDDLIMDHIKNARNYQALQNADREITGDNPLCGDQIAVYINISADRIADIGFQCTCCGISMASASIMTEMVKGKLVDEVQAQLREFMAAVGDCDNLPRSANAGWRAIVETIRRFPARARCAVLPWTTLESGLTLGTNRQGEL
jgi:nitrogen fixation protein NifU and related proteins